MKRVLLNAIAASLLLASSAWAASDGTEGTTSSGTSDLSVVIPKLVKIVSMTNLSQTYDGSSGGFDQSGTPCVYSNMDTGGLYTVKITGSNNPKSTSPTAGFFVGNATTDQEIAYTVKWNDQSGNTGEAAVTNNTDLTDQSGYDTSVSCSASNANYRVQMTQANLLSRKPATYTGRITVLITPQ